jgi:DNA-binding response OmpR family regulator
VSGAREETVHAVSVLAVTPYEEDAVTLRHIFSHSNWHIDFASSWTDASTRLSEQRYPVVISEARLSDASWQEALGALESTPGLPLLIVTSRQANDELWAEVLNLGGYDVLMKPFDRAEVVRVVSLAWLNWKHRSSPARFRASGPKLAAAG